MDALVSVEPLFLQVEESEVASRESEEHFGAAWEEGEAAEGVAFAAERVHFGDSGGTARP